MKLIKVAIPTALALGLIAAGPASAQSRRGGGGGGGGGHAAARGGAVVAAPRGGGGGYPGGGHVAASHGPVYVAPRGHAVAVPRSYGYGYGGNHYHAPYYGHYPSYGYGYGHAHYAPYYRPYYYGDPYYSFHSHFSIGFGLYLGYPVPYPVQLLGTRIRCRILTRTRLRLVPGSWVPAPYSNPYPPQYQGQYPGGHTRGIQDPQGGYPQQSVSATAVSAAVREQPAAVRAAAGRLDDGDARQDRRDQLRHPALERRGLRGRQDYGTVANYTPRTQPLALAPGRHRVEIRAQGRQNMTFDADIQAGQVTPYQGTLAN